MPESMETPAPAPVTESSEAPETEVASEESQDSEIEAAEPRRLKMKVDGEEVSMTEEEAIRYASMGKSAQKRFQEAAQLRKEAEDIVAGYRGDIRAALKDPENLKAFEEAYVAMLEFESMSPEDKERHDKDKKLAEYENADKRRKEEADQEEFSRLEQQYVANYEKQFISALETVNLPKHPETIKRMAAYIHRAQEAGVSVTAADVAPYVRDDLIREIKGTLGGLDHDGILQLLGDDIAGKIRKADLARVKGSQQFGKAAPAPKQTTLKAGPKDLDDFLDGI